MLRYFKKQKVKAQLIRSLPGEYVDGEWVPDHGITSDIKIIAPQPIAANDTVNLPDGEHVRDYLKTYTTQKVMSREDSEDADTIFWKGNFYKAYQVDDRVPLGNYHKIIMRRQEPEVWDNAVIDSETGKLVVDSKTGELVIDA